jgi:hypothetical protein
MRYKSRKLTVKTVGRLMKEAQVVKGLAAEERLAEMGLDRDRLLEVVEQGQMAVVSCTANHPPFVPSLWGWGETVRALREYLLPLGWFRSDTKNYSLVINPSKRCAIAVATGNEGTGLEDASPATKTPKGPNTIGAIVQNQQLNMFYAPDKDATELDPDNVDGEQQLTWVLLIHRGLAEVRCELSLPVSIGDDGRIDGWRERIIVGSLSTGGADVEIVPPVTPDITVDVRRRA